MNYDVDYGKYDMPRAEFAVIAAAAFAADLFIFYLFYRSIFVCIIMLPLTEIFFIDRYKKYRIEKRKWKLICEFEEMLGCISNALRTGYSLENSFFEAKKELEVLYGEKRDILCELGNICRKLRLNYTIESILEDFAKRSGEDDISSFAEIISVAKRSGGNMIAIVKQTADNFHDKREIEEEIRTLVAGKRLEYRIMSVMPIGMLIYLGICSPGYMDILYGNILGQAVMTLGLVIYALSYCISKKIMSFNEMKERASKKRGNKAGRNSVRFAALYGLMKKSRFGGVMKKISYKIEKICLDIPKEEACMRFFGSLFLSAAAGIAAAFLIVLAGLFYAKDNILYIAVLSLNAAVFIPYGRVKELDKKIKYRNEQLIFDYPEVVNRMCLLIGAGSSMKGAWGKIVHDYLLKKEKNRTRPRYVYEEMKRSLYELNNGVSEAAVYEKFGQNIRLIPYMKLSAMLTYNLKKGNRYILEQLNISSLDAYVQRRENVKKMGEEASSKLLLPIMLQFILVLMIIMYPAIMSL